MQPLDHLLLGDGLLQGEVGAVVAGRAEFALQVGDDLLERRFGVGHDLQQQQPHENPVAFGNVTLDAHPAGLLAADQHVTVQHVIGDVIEADGRLVHRQTIASGDAVDHHGRAHRLDHIAAPAAPLCQVAQRQRHDGMRIYEVAVAVHRAHAIGVAVGGDAYVGVHRIDRRRHHVQVFADRFRVNAAEAGVHFAANLVHLAARARQNGADRRAPGAIHGIGDDGQLALRNLVNVHQRFQVFIVGVGGVEATDQPFLDGPFVVHQVGAAPFALCQFQETLDLGALFRQRRAAVGRLQLEAIVARRVVRGGDHHARYRFLVHDVVADGGGRGVGARQPGDDAVGGQHPRRLDGETVGKEARIEADDHLRR